MPSIGSLETLLRAIAEQTAHGLLAVDPHGGQRRSRRNASQQAAEASAHRYQGEAVTAWLAQHHARSQHTSGVTDSHHRAGADGTVSP